MATKLRVVLLHQSNTVQTGTRALRAFRQALHMDAFRPSYPEGFEKMSKFEKLKYLSQFLDHSYQLVLFREPKGNRALRSPSRKLAEYVRIRHRIPKEYSFQTQVTGRMATPVQMQGENIEPTRGNEPSRIRPDDARALGINTRPRAVVGQNGGRVTTNTFRLTPATEAGVLQSGGNPANVNSNRTDAVLATVTDQVRIPELANNSWDGQSPIFTQTRASEQAVVMAPETRVRPARARRNERRRTLLRRDSWIPRLGR